ncbi:MAG: ABC transporter permease [Anaerolineae bacterium]|nr:ABC transporter permease [Anaerolineae bacterium]
MDAQAGRSEIKTEPKAELSMAQESTRDLWMRRLKVLAPVWTLLVMWIFFSLATPSFLTAANFNNILSQSATAGILAVGMTFVLLTGEIDLSIAAVMALAAEVSVQLYTNYHLPEPVPLIAALLVGILCGAGSGIISTVIRVPTFMATLAMSLIAEGLTLWISQGRQFFQTEISPLTLWIGSEKIGGDAGLRQGVMILLCAFCLLIGYLVLRYTRFGRYVYMTGANPYAARLAGINTRLMVFAVLTICGFTAGVAGIAAQGRLGTALPSPQSGYLIQAIAVVVLGGTSLNGGKGGIWQTTIGLLIYGSLTNGLDNIANINSFAKTFITGLVLLGALIVNIVFAGRAPRDRT